MADHYSSTSKKRRTSAAPPSSSITSNHQNATYFGEPSPKRSKGRTTNAMGLSPMSNPVIGGMPAPPPVDRPKMTSTSAYTTFSTYKPSFAKKSSASSPYSTGASKSTAYAPSRSSEVPSGSYSTPSRTSPFSSRLSAPQAATPPSAPAVPVQAMPKKVDPLTPPPATAKEILPPPPSHSNSSPPILKQAPKDQLTSSSTPAKSHPHASISPPAAKVPYRRSTSAPSGNVAKTPYYKHEIPETQHLEVLCPLPAEATTGDVPSWGLPFVAVEIFKKKGLKQIHDWQRECLMNTGVIGGQSLVYSLPTSGGKTYVAEVLLMRTVFQHRKIALFVLPYVAIVNEKVRSLKEFGKPLNFEVEGFFNNNGRLPLQKSKPILCICTIEKANLITNTLIEEGRIDELGLVVFDEMHMLCQQQRGYLLEILGTKIKYASNNKVQMVGMSATLPNLVDLGNWLNASCYYRNFRPVVLSEHVFNGLDLLVPELKPVDHSVSPNGSMSPSGQRKFTHHYVAKKIASINSGTHSRLQKPAIAPPLFVSPVAYEGAFQLARELMPFSGTLIFCSSRQMSSSLALKFAQRLQTDPIRRTGYAPWLDWLIGSEDASLRVAADRPLLEEREWIQKMQQIKEDREILVKQLRAATSKTLNEDLVTCLMQGIAWHTAELGTAERESIERAFRSKTISVICCTSTLAAGVNLPARRVVLITSKMGKEDLSVSDYRQMVGRAGRAGIDAIGESFLFAIPPKLTMTSTEQDLSNHRALRLLVTPMDAIQSSLSKPSTSADSEWRTLSNARRSLYQRSKDPRTEIARFPNLPHDPKIVCDPFLVNPSSTDIPPVSYFLFAYHPDREAQNTAAKTYARFLDCGAEIEPSGCGIDRLVLDAIAGRSAVTDREIFKFLKCTFLASSRSDAELQALIKNGLRFLTAVCLIESVSADRAMRIQSNEIDVDLNDPTANQAQFNKLKSQKRDYKAAALNERGELESVWVTTQFGSATYRTSLSIESVLYLREELERAMDSMVLRLDLHMCWLSIPVMHRLKPLGGKYEAWKATVERCLVAHKLSRLTEAERIEARQADEENYGRPRYSYNVLEYSDQEKAQGAFGARVGVIADSLGQKLGMGLPSPASQPSERFLLTLLLQDIVEEVKLVDVARKYEMSLGDLENLMQNAGNQAGQLAYFCQAMGWHHLESLFRLFCGRVSAGAKDDILPLMKLRFVKAARARMLYNADFKTIRSIANAEPHQIAQVLAGGSTKSGESATKLATVIIRSATELLEQTIKEMRIQAARLEDPTPTPEQATPPTPVSRVTRRTSRLNSASNITRSSSNLSKGANPNFDNMVNTSLAQIDSSFYDSLFGDDLLLLEEFEQNL